MEPEDTDNLEVLYLRVPPNLKRRIKIQADRDMRTMRAWLILAIEELLTKRESDSEAK